MKNNTIEQGDFISAECTDGKIENSREKLRAWRHFHYKESFVSVAG